MLVQSMAAKLFDAASEALLAAVDFEVQTPFEYGYEITPVFDNNRDVTGYQVLVKDVDGFTAGYLGE